MIKNQYDTFLEELFENLNTVFIASELIEKVCNKFNVKNNYARQIISRAHKKGIIKSSEPFQFENKQYYYMHVKGNLNYNTLFEICKKYKKPLHRLLWLLEMNNGVISMYEAQKITSTPVSNSEKYRTISLKKELQLLQKMNFIKIMISEKTQERFIVKCTPENNYEHKIELHREKINEDVYFILDIVRWFSNRGFTTGAPIYRNKKNPSIGAIINDFLFDVKAFTETTGFNASSVIKDSKKSIVAMDILLYRKYTDIDLVAFYERIQILRNSTKSRESLRNIMPILVYKDIDLTTKKQLENLHILHFSIDDMLGSKIKYILRNLTVINELIEKNHLSKEENIKVIKAVQNSLNMIEDSGQENNLQNVKGDLFESLMFIIFSNIYVRDKVKQSVRVKNPKEPNKQPYEYDLVIFRNKEIIIIELKGLKNSTIINWGPNTMQGTASWFFGNTYPIIKEHYVSKFSRSKKEIKGSYITSANFSPEAIEKLEKINKSQVKADKLEVFYDRKKLLDFLRENKELDDIREDTNFIETLKKYYLTERKK